jgi:Mn2+/Fe2+ NRAMP family transporter
MAFSNLIAFFIILTTAVTLNAAGKTDIQTSVDAAAALEPVAGRFAVLLFSLGILGTGLLAIPVLAGSAGYAVAEARGWASGLERKPKAALGFYAVIGLATLFGFALHDSPLDPIKALFWSAVLNGLISVPVMAAMMIVVGRASVMGRFTAPPLQLLLGWLATLVMSAVALGMFVLR